MIEERYRQVQARMREDHQRHSVKVMGQGMASLEWWTFYLAVCIAATEHHLDGARADRYAQRFGA